MKKKRHQIVVTITHDKPVSRKQALEMFRGTYCLPGHPTEYYPTANYWEVEVGEAKIMTARSAKETRE